MGSCSATVIRPLMPEQALLPPSLLLLQQEHGAGTQLQGVATGSFTAVSAARSLPFLTPVCEQVETDT